jgi:hypothetical protein
MQFGFGLEPCEFTLAGQLRMNYAFAEYIVHEFTAHFSLHHLR